VSDTKHQTLIDQLYAQTFGKKVEAWQSNKLMRRALTDARRFILDDAMAAFLADITSAGCDKRTDTIRFKAVHQMRAAARLPHDLTWVEFDLVKYIKREQELLGYRGFDCDAFSEIREGWLLNGFSQDTQEFRLHLFIRAVEPDGTVHHTTFPIAILWRTDQNKPHGYISFGDRDGTDHTSELLDLPLGAHGAAQIFPQVTFAPSELLLKSIPDDFTVTKRGVSSSNGVMRRLWSFLSTVNDIPVIIRSARTAKGFTAKARRHPFLEHRILQLHVPHQTDYRKLARSIVAAAKRRAHTVRGHWRKHYHRPLVPLCEHEFETVDSGLRCKKCHGQRIFVHEHQRGDASVGFVTHDYRVVH